MMRIRFCGLNFSHIVTVLILYTQYVQISVGIEAKIDFNVEGNGFHRTIIYRVKFKNLTNHDCRAAIYLELPSALYVNVDEIAELRRRGTNTICSVGETDVELFSEKAEPQNVTACTLVRSSSSCVLRIPIHQRYQYAREDGGYINVTLPMPKLFLGCRGRVKGHRISKVDLCEPCLSLMTKWREISYNKSKDYDYVWPIPVGDSSLSTFVTCATLSITIVGAIFIARAIRTNVLKNQQKKD